MSDSHAHGTAHDHDDTVMYEPHVVQHASRKTYVIVGAILCAITAVELMVYSMPSLGGVLIPVLLVLSVVKFVIVVEFFMHLRYDQKPLSRVFFGPLTLACVVVIGMIMLFKVIPKFAW